MKHAQRSGAFSTEVGKRPGWWHEGIGRSNGLPIVARVQRGGWPVFATVSRIRDSIGTGRQHSAPRTDVSEINAIVDGLNPRSILSFGCRSGSGIATSSEAARLPAHSHSGLCLRRSLNGDSWMSQGAPRSGETGGLVGRFPQRIRRIKFSPRVIPPAPFKPSPSGMNRILSSQPRVAATRRTLGYESMSLQDMREIAVVFGRMTECPMSWPGIRGASIQSLEPSMTRSIGRSIAPVEIQSARFDPPPQVAIAIGSDAAIAASSCFSSSMRGQSSSMLSL